MSFGGGGGGGGGSGDVINHQNEQARKQHKYNKAVYDFNWKGSIDDPEGREWKKYNWQVEGFELQKNKDRAQKDYQEETARQNWEFGKSQVDYGFDQQNRAFNKSTQVYRDTLGLNQVGLDRAFDREDKILEEQFIDAAFQNQNLIQELYEQTGTAGFDKTSKQLALWNAEGESDYAEASKLTNLRQLIEGSQFDTAGKELEFVDQQGQTAYTKAGIQQDLYNKEGVNKLKKVEVGIGLQEQKTREQLENQVIMRDQENQRAQAAFGVEQKYVESLTNQGEAAVTQAGRSSGKAQLAVIAALGRNTTYMIDQLVRGKESADAQIKANKINTLNATQRAALAEQQIDFSSLDNLTKAEMQLEEADRSLAIGGKGNQLDLDKIKSLVAQGAETTGLDIQEIARSLKGKQTLTGLDLDKIDWNIENVGSRFKQNQNILKASLDSAMESSLMNKGDKLVAKAGADLEAEARRMLRPSKQPYAPAPLDLPDLVYQDPLAPEKPPEPIEGAMLQSSGGGGSFASTASNILGGVTAGLGAASTAMSLGMAASAATPLGIAVGLGSMLFG